MKTEDYTMMLVYLFFGVFVFVTSLRMYNGIENCNDLELEKLLLVCSVIGLTLLTISITFFMCVSRYQCYSDKEPVKGHNLFLSMFIALTLVLLIIMSIILAKSKKTCANSYVYHTGVTVIVISVVSFLLGSGMAYYKYKN